MKKVSIIGSGLVGSMLSIYMAKRGFQVSVYERRADMRKQTTDRGRSINLALSDRGLNALAAIGLEEEVRKMAIPMHGRMIHAVDGTTNFQPYGKEGQYINSISRGGLNELLMNEAEKHDHVQFQFQCKSLEVDNATKEVLLQNEKGEKFSTESNLIFGTDGAFSMVRNALQKTDQFNYSQAYLEHGYKELNIPPDAEGNWQLEKNALHIWPRKSFMLIALPNLDGSFTLTLFLAFKGEYAFEHLQSKEAATHFFKQFFPDALALMPQFEQDFFSNPTSSLLTVKCYPWVHADKICLLGDAAHAIVPFYGQGMNCGFEDCFVLNETMNQYAEQAQFLQAFQQQRKPDADAIAQLALYNFIEMRDLVADPDYLARRKIETTMHSRQPKKFVPLYSLVTFGNTRYSEAWRLGNLYKDFFKDKPLQEVANAIDKPETLALIDKWADEILKRNVKQHD